MFSQYSLVFDIGGTFITAAVVNDCGEVAKDTISYYPAMSGSGKETILNHLTHIICQQTGNILDKTFAIGGIGFAFPGPFDYANGISLISGVQKFESLFGVDLRRELSERLSSQKVFASRMAPRFHIAFENNAHMFALGEWLAGEAGKFRKSICFTIGNGAGSAFLDRGELVKLRGDVPHNGWVYNTPFKDSIVDDYISNRGIYRLAAQYSALRGMEVEEIASLARAGHTDAAAVFREFGVWFGEMLDMFMKPFRPDGIVIGGRMALSFDLFSASIARIANHENATVAVSKNTAFSTFAGISDWLSRHREQGGGP